VTAEILLQKVDYLLEFLELCQEGYIARFLVVFLLFLDVFDALGLEELRMAHSTRYASGFLLQVLLLLAPPFLRFVDLLFFVSVEYLANIFMGVHFVVEGVVR